MEMQDPHKPMYPAWNPFAASQLVSIMLKTGRVEQSVPPVVAAGLRIISLYQISNEWARSIDVGKLLADRSIVYETYELLNKAGFKEDNSIYIVNCLIASIIGGHYTMSALFDAASDSIAVTVAKALMAGYAGIPDQSLLHWLLDRGPENQTATLARTLNEVAQGNECSLRGLISLIFPFWKNLVEEWTGEDFNISSLGFLFESASRLPDHPALMAWRAMMIHRFGFSGDEDAAYRLIAQAAFLGSPEAWRLIEEWSFCSGDQERVMKALIDVGREKFCKLQE